MRGCVQAKLWCTSIRARKVVVSLTVVALTAEVINAVCRHVAHDLVADIIYSVVFRVVVPVSVLVINMVVVYKVRRAATNAAANLGVQPHHHQSTSSSSVVPTVMLVATSLIYVLLYSTSNILIVTEIFHINADVSDETLDVVTKSQLVAGALAYLVFAYNFYIYIITGRQFRSELYNSFRCFLSSSSSSSAIAHDAEVA